MTDIVIDPFEDQSWRDRARCRGMDLEIFFPSRGQPTREAKVVCSECPVQRECGTYGLMEKFGVWGGMSEKERRSQRGWNGYV